MKFTHTPKYFTSYPQAAISCILSTVFLFLFVMSASAQTHTWTGATSSEWNLSGNWVGGIPATGEATTIDIVSGTMPVISIADAATGALVIGNFAGGATTQIVTIQGGRKLNVSAGVTLNQNGTKGQVIVTGTGSEMNVTGQLTVGSQGLGTVDILNQGKVANANAVIGNGALGSGVVNLSGGSIWNISGNLTLGNSGIGSLNISGGSAVTITGATLAPVLGKTGSGRGSMTVTGTSSSFTSSHFSMYVGSDSLSTASSQSGVLTIADGGNVKLNGASGNGDLQLANKVGTSGTLNIGAGAAAGTLSAATVTGGAGTAKVVFNQSGTGYSFVPRLRGTLSVTHSGSGSTALTGSNDYSGGTTVTFGTLLANHAMNSLGSGSISVSGSSAVLGGTGRIANGISSFSVDNGGSILAGNGVSELTALTIAGNLTLADSSKIQIVLGPGLESSTLARESGTWTFDSDQAISFTLTGGATIGTYENIITGLAANPWGGGSSPWTIVNPGMTGQFVWDGANVDFVMTTIPEPNAAALIGLGFILVLAKVRGLRARR